MTLWNRRRWIGGLLLVGWLASASGCGTIFYPERKGQPAGRLDPKVVALDAVGLLLFFVPGVIAFAVDFNNGTIYLPPDSHAATDKNLSGWSTVHTASKTPSAEEIERIVQQRTGKSVRLQPGRYRVGQLKGVTELADLNLDQIELATTCHATDVRFRAQSK